MKSMTTQPRFLAALLFACLVPGEAGAESRLEGGGAVIIQFVEQYRRDHWTPSGSVADLCKRFRAARNDMAFFTPSFTCDGTSGDDFVAHFQRDKVDTIRREINSSARVNPEIRAMKNRQDNFLKAIHAQWASTCRAAREKTRDINTEAQSASKGGCDYLGNAANVFRAAASANRFAIQLKANARSYWAGQIRGAYEKDRKLVYGVATRAFQKSGYGKNMQKEVERLYESQGPFESLIEGMDYEICLDSQVVGEYEESAAESAKRQSDCRSMR